MALDLLSPFTGSAYSDAANKQRAMLGQLYLGAQGNIGNAQAQGLAALTSGREGALGAIGPAITQARSDISGALDPAVSALVGAQGAGVGALTAGQTRGLAALRSGVEQATGAYSPLQAATGRYGEAGYQASQAQADALGLNGPEGIARAQQTFQATPGYQFQLGQGIDALTRSMNAAGGGNVLGGNLERAAQTFGSGLANQEFQKYLANLQQRQQLYAPLEAQGASAYGTGVANAALTGGTGAANIYTGTGAKLSDLISSTGANLANAYIGTGRSLADLAKTGGLAEADIYGQNAAQQANLINSLTQQGTNLTTNFAPLYGQTYGAEAAAQTQGANNLWNLGLEGLKMAGGFGFLPTGGFKAAGPYAPKPTVG